MDDNKINPQENQPLMENEIVPEEVSPDVATPLSDEISESEGQISEPPPPIYEENKTKYIFIAVAALIFFLLLIFFIKIFSKKDVPKNVSLTYWGLWEEKTVFQPLIDDYQRKNPNVKINYEKKPAVEYREKLIARSKNGQGPDIFRFHNTWLPQIKEVAAPMPSSIISNQDFEKVFYKIYQKDLKVGEYYYGIPLYLDGIVLIVNDSLLKKGGVDSVPVTWDELLETAAKLTVKSGDQIITSGIALGTASNIEHFSEILGLILLQNGASLSDLSTNEAIEALQSYRKFAELPNNFWDENMPNSITAFIQEKVAMIFAPSWQILSIRGANPDLKIKVASFPTMTGLNPISLATYWSEGVSRFSKNQLEAWKFLKYLSEKENMSKLYEYQSKERLFGEPYSRIDLGTTLVQNEYIGPVIKQADAYTSLPLSARTFDNGMNDEIIKYLENAVNATINGVSYSEAFRTAKQGIDQVFAKYKVE